jgi:hypothetical protein
VEAWKKRWLETSEHVGSWVTGKTSVKNSWIKALSWDPWWIRRRPSKGWLRPKNWYEGCLMSASVAIRAVTSELEPGTDAATALNAEVVGAVSRRLQSQLEIIQAGKSEAAIDPETMTGQLSCFDEADSLAGMGGCIQVNADPSLQAQTDEYKAWQLVRILLAGGAAPVDPLLAAPLTLLQEKLTSENSTTKIDYAAELQFLRDVHQAGYKTEGIFEKVASQFSEVKLTP